MGYAFGVGRKAPAFVLRDREDTEVSLARYRGDWLVVLVFVPGPASAASLRLAPLAAAANQLWGLRAQLIGIYEATASPTEPTAQLRQEPPFPLLGDDGAVSAAYSVRRIRGELRPTAFIIDRAGKIVWMEEGDEALDAATITAALREVAR